MPDASPQPNFADTAILQARQDWAEGRYKSDDDHEVAKGLPKGTLARWRRQRRPDGRDWADFKAGVTAPAAVMEIIPRVSRATPMDVARAKGHVGAQMINVARAALLDSEGLYLDPPEVRQRRGLPPVYNAAGDIVPIGRLFPTKASEALDLAKFGVKCVDEAAEALEALGSAEGRLKEAMIDQLVELAEELDLTAEQRKKLAALMAGGVTEGGEEAEDGEFETDTTGGDDDVD